MVDNSLNCLICNDGPFNLSTMRYHFLSIHNMDAADFVALNAKCAICQAQFRNCNDYLECLTSHFFSSRRILDNSQQDLSTSEGNSSVSQENTFSSPEDQFLFQATNLETSKETVRDYYAQQSENPSQHEEFLEIKELIDQGQFNDSFSPDTLPEEGALNAASVRHKQEDMIALDVLKDVREFSGISPIYSIPSVSQGSTSGITMHYQNSPQWSFNDRSISPISGRQVENNEIYNQSENFRLSLEGKEIITQNPGAQNLSGRCAAELKDTETLNVGHATNEPESKRGKWTTAEMPEGLEEYINVVHSSQLGPDLLSGSSGSVNEVKSDDEEKA